MLPEELQAAISAAAGPISRAEPLGGSFGAQLLRLTAGGARFALKWAAAGAPAAMVAAEVDGLRRLAAAGAVRVPALAAAATGEAGPAFLLTEWLDGGGAAPDEAALGTQLAALHRHSAPAFGLEHDNFIGSTPQRNGWLADWPTFFRERRLHPQLELAAAAGLLPTARHRALERLLGRLDQLLTVAGAPALIHGDLWGGNLVAAPGGAPALIDPSVSYSHREAEIAYSELFSGFSPGFYAAYSAAWPLEPGYAERREIHNLYHLLNHLNLFGERYGPHVDAVLRRYGG